jgi:hypothetical protein
LKQASATLQQRVAQEKPTFICLTEVWLKEGDSLDAEMLPRGYKVFARRDRPNSSHGGVLILGLETLLVDELDLEQYYVPGQSEIVGVEYQEFCVFCAYTQESKVAPVMFDNLALIREAPEFKDKSAIFLMDANAHHESWLGSKLTDNAGECAKAFSEVYDLQQFVDFPTRGDNILDLVYCDCKCVTTELPHLGTSDHVAMMVKVDTNVELPPPPPVRAVLHYSSAPWNHINGHLKRTFKGWNPCSHGAVDAAAVDAALGDFYDKVGATSVRYIPSSVPTHARPAPWWDSHCTLALKVADKTLPPETRIKRPTRRRGKYSRRDSARPTRSTDRSSRRRLPRADQPRTGGTRPSYTRVERAAARLGLLRFKSWPSSLRRSSAWMARMTKCPSSSRWTE